jgi:SAM-dependent methyltransferase
VEASPESYRAAWMGKPVLRAIYADYYARIVARVPRGPVLEIGGGSGNLKAVLPDVVSSDIVAAPWLDVVADAHALPFADGSFAGIVMVDVLHHLAHPRRFLAEATRVLRPGGRVVMVEPGITPASHLFFRLFHPEPVRMDADPLGNAPLNDPSDPWDANQGLPTLLFRRHAARYAVAFPRLVLREASLLSLFAYPLSGGFRQWSLLPVCAVGPLLALEDRLLPWLGPAMAFRLLVVLERAP